MDDNRRGRDQIENNEIKNNNYIYNNRITNKNIYESDMFSNEEERENEDKSEVENRKKDKKTKKKTININRNRDENEEMEDEEMECTSKNQSKSGEDYVVFECETEEECGNEEEESSEKGINKKKVNREQKITKNSDRNIRFNNLFTDNDNEEEYKKTKKKIARLYLTDIRNKLRTKNNKATTKRDNSVKNTTKIDNILGQNKPNKETKKRNKFTENTNKKFVIRNNNLRLVHEAGKNTDNVEIQKRKEKKNKDLSVDIEDNMLRDITELNLMANDGSKKDNDVYKKKNDYIYDQLRDLKKTVEEIKDKQKNISTGGYYIVDENRTIQNFDSNKHILIKDASQLAKDLANGDYSARIQDLIKKVSELKSFKKLLKKELEEVSEEETDADMSVTRDDVSERSERSESERSDNEPYVMDDAESNDENNIFLNRDKDEEEENYCLNEDRTITKNLNKNNTTMNNTITEKRVVNTRGRVNTKQFTYDKENKNINNNATNIRTSNNITTGATQ